MSSYLLTCGALILVYLSSDTHHAKASDCPSSVEPVGVTQTQHHQLLVESFLYTATRRQHLAVQSTSSRSILLHFDTRLRLLANILIVDWFRVLATTAGSGDSVIAALAHGDASFSREVAEETGEEQGEEGHCGPADAAAGLRAGERLVGARVLVVTGAVVEKPLDAADARPVLHCVLRRAHAPMAAHPAGGQHPWATAVRTLAPSTALALVGVFSGTFMTSAAWNGHHHPGVVIQRF